jgi:hypothetical protein
MFAPPVDATLEVRGLLAGVLPAADLQTVESAFRETVLYGGGQNCEIPPAMMSGFDMTDPAAPTLVATATFGCDDSGGGSRFTIHLVGDDAQGWTVASATREFLCLRGVSGGLCV